MQMELEGKVVCEAQRSRDLVACDNLREVGNKLKSIEVSSLSILELLSCMQNLKQQRFSDVRNVKLSTSAAKVNW